MVWLASYLLPPRRLLHHIANHRQRAEIPVAEEIGGLRWRVSLSVVFIAVDNPLHSNLPVTIAWVIPAPQPSNEQSSDCILNEFVIRSCMIGSD
jgi:hypothetical protein